MIPPVTPAIFEYEWLSVAALTEDCSRCILDLSIIGKKCGNKVRVIELKARTKLTLERPLHSQQAQMYLENYRTCRNLERP